MPNQRVLIVDDEQRTLMFLRESLVVSGLTAETICVSSAEQALQALDEQPFDVVITDVRLAGGMSGLELLEKLRRLYPNLRSILVSAYEDAETMTMARELGVYHCFRKPFAFDEFTDVVADALREATMELNPSHLTVDWSTQVIHRQLTDLMRDTGAQCVLLTKNDGAVVARVGDTVCFQGPWPVPTTSQGPAFNFAYQQGKTHDVYSADVSQDMRLSLAFDRNQPSGRIGLVLQCTRRAVQELATALGSPTVRYNHRQQSETRTRESIPPAMPDNPA
jgi:DNA-binding response OmpR family regulator